jgi:L-idonate 5-dehydrogenase
MSRMVGIMRGNMVNGQTSQRSTLGVVCHAARTLKVEPVPVPDIGDSQVELAIAAGGICGSDLHYYLDGRIGAIEVRQPFVLGHEFSATVTAIGRAVTALQIGDRVAVNPARACGTCRYCQAGLQIHCLDMLFYGSAMRFPHVSGGFRQVLMAEATQCEKLPADFSLAKAAFAEPLAVCLHAVERAGPLAGRRVLVTGCGPIGALTILAARHAGAGEITVTDVSDSAIAIGLKIGADAAINVARQPERLAAFSANKGTFDVVFECSGHQAAIRSAMDAIKPRGILVLVGLGGETQVMINTIVAKEIDVRGTFRFGNEFQTAVQALVSGRIDPMPLLTEIIPFREAQRAFDLAADRSRAMKVQLAFA